MGARDGGVATKQLACGAWLVKNERTSGGTSDNGTTASKGRGTSSGARGGRRSRTGPALGDHDANRAEDCVRSKRPSCLCCGALAVLNLLTILASNAVDQGAYGETILRMFEAPWEEHTRTLFAAYPLPATTTKCVKATCDFRRDAPLERTEVMLKMKWVYPAPDDADSATRWILRRRDDARGDVTARRVSASRGRVRTVE